MSWLSDRWGEGGPTGTILGALQGKQRSVNALRNDAGGILKVGSDVVAPFTGPFAPLVAGAGNALGSAIEPGTNFGNIAGSGLMGAGIGYAGAGALGGVNAANASGAGLGGDIWGGLKGALMGAPSTSTPASVGAGGASAAASNPIDLSTMSPSTVQAVGDATDPTGGMTDSQLANTADATSAGGGGSNTMGNILKQAGPIGQALTSGVRTAQSQQEINIEKAREQLAQQQYTDYKTRQQQIGALVNPLYQQLMGQLSARTSAPSNPNLRTGY